MKIEDVFGEEVDSDIEILNYKIGYSQRPYTYGYSKPKNTKQYQRNNNVSNRKNDICNNCGKRGHYAADCYVPAPRRHNNNVSQIKRALAVVKLGTS